MIRRKSKAVVNTSIAVKSKKTNIRNDLDTFVEDVLVSPGDAQVTVTHGKKYWSSTRADGMSVESTCTVKLSCAQNVDALAVANDQASELAYVYMKKNYKRVLADIDAFNSMED